MAILKGKGCALQQDLVGVYTAIAQVIDLSFDGFNAETFEADTLDNSNAGIPHKVTGRTEGGTLSGNMFFDPALAGHKNLTTLLTTPVLENWKVAFSDSPISYFTFSGTFSLTGPTIALNDGVKSGFSIKIDGIPTYPT